MINSFGNNNYNNQTFQTEYYDNNQIIQPTNSNQQIIQSTNSNQQIIQTFWSDITNTQITVRELSQFELNTLERKIDLLENVEHSRTVFKIFAKDPNFWNNYSKGKNNSIGLKFNLTKYCPSVLCELQEYLTILNITPKRKEPIIFNAEENRKGSQRHKHGNNFN